MGKSRVLNYEWREKESEGRRQKGKGRRRGRFRPPEFCFGEGGDVNSPLQAGRVGDPPLPREDGALPYQKPKRR